MQRERWVWVSESGVSILIRTRFPLDADTCPTWYLFVSKWCEGPLNSAHFWGPRLLIACNTNFWQQMRVNTLCLNLGWVVDQLWSVCRDTKCFSLDNVSSSLQTTCGSEAGLKTGKINPFNLVEPCLSCRAFGAVVLWWFKHFRKFWVRWLFFQCVMSVSAGGRFLPFCLHQRGKLGKQRHELFAWSWGGECVISTAEKEMVLYRLLVTEKAKACLLLPPHHWSDCWVDMDQYTPFLLNPLALHIFT